MNNYTYDAYEAAVIEEFTMLFYMLHNEDLESDKIVDDWMKACYRKGKTPQMAAAIIQRAYYLYKFVTGKRALKTVFIRGFQSKDKNVSNSKAAFYRYFVDSTLPDLDEILYVFLEYVRETHGYSPGKYIIRDFLNYINNREQNAH